MRVRLEVEVPLPDTSSVSAMNCEFFRLRTPEPLMLKGFAFGSMKTPAR